MHATKLEQFKATAPEGRILLNLTLLMELLWFSRMTVRSCMFRKLSPVGTVCSVVLCRLDGGGCMV
jgi:hypothetical protein